MCIGSMLCGVFVWLYHSHLQINTWRMRREVTLFFNDPWNQLWPFYLFCIKSNKNILSISRIILKSFSYNGISERLCSEWKLVINKYDTKNGFDYLSFAWNNAAIALFHQYCSRQKSHNRKVYILYHRIIMHSINSITCICRYTLNSLHPCMGALWLALTHDDVLDMNRFLLLFVFSSHSICTYICNSWVFRWLLAQPIHMCACMHVYGGVFVHICAYFVCMYACMHAFVSMFQSKASSSCNINLCCGN